jgi:hypothetical protein
MARLLEHRSYRPISTTPYGLRVFRKGQFKVTYLYRDGKPVDSLDPGRPPRWYLEIEAWQSD